MFTVKKIMNLCDHNPVWRLILAKMSEIRPQNADQVTFSSEN